MKMTKVVKLNVNERIIDKYDENENWIATYTLYKDVKNISEIHQKLVNGELEAAIINPCLIAQALKTFGINDKLNALLVVTICPETQYKTEDEETLSDIINGKICSIEEDLELFTNEELLKKIYKLTDEEVKHGSIVNSIVGRMALKDVL
ncbi:EKC/KEOPS complex subunit Tprkb [Armadillidium nasatum]|uniref:EKC/KEOPS complex subunit Tprkb n=1 Tax=Armadillidium nasatum TaxID=96803 RepID=A0A5N5TE47_9CRUS|nr:EKC/KEOPS complex subunit Tprkb [Armadillidium nasatum]